MKLPGIQSRILLAAVLPAALVAVVLATVFVVLRVGDNLESHQHLARLLARQVASASEFGVFTGNTANLQSIATEALKQTDVRSVVITDAQGVELVRAGQALYPGVPTLPAQQTESVLSTLATDRLTQPIVAGVLKLDDAPEPRAQATAAPQVVGHVVMEVSRESLIKREQNMVRAGVAIAVAGLLFALALGVALGRGVLGPVMRVSRMIVEIGRGGLSVREPVLPNDPLRDIQLGLNQMAARLQANHEDMRLRIESATTELRQRKEEAEQATLAKSQFLAAASHDLRQPTHALGMFVARLSQLPHDPPTQHLVANLEASVQAMQDLLDGLMDISRLDAGNIQIKPRAVAVSTMFDQVQQSLQGLAQDKGLRLRFRPTRVWIDTDPVLFQRILLNLVSNAVRYTQAGSVLVSCRVSSRLGAARIEVWDSGIGIAPEHHELIFKEFYQVGNSARDRTKGLGLGLNIVWRTAQLAGHPLAMRSSLGCGSRFTVQVPLAAPQVLAATARPAAGTLQGQCVLVIEDDDLARQALVSLLTSWGCAVVAAQSQASALLQVQTLVPNKHRLGVIVSDYRLRDGENGFTAIAAVRQRLGHHVPACLTSGDTDPQLIQQARASGLTLLHKPVRPAKLRSLLTSLLAQEAPGLQVDAHSESRAAGVSE
jgi:two-component system, sensor histidine kinase